MAKTNSATKLAAPSARRKPARKSAAKRAPTLTPDPIRCDETLAAAFAALRAVDGAFIDNLVSAAGPPPLRLRAPGLEGLAAIIISQQVSTASARAIQGRLSQRFPNITAAALLTADDDELRACGLSAGKMKTLRAIASAIVEGRLDFDALAKMEADAARAAMTAIHGVGPWTADIYLLFCLGHPDAWPAGDLALQEAARMALKLRARPDAKKLERIAERWRPARGVAARILWAWYGVVKRRGDAAP